MGSKENILYTSVNIIGGLGNHLFQISMLLHYIKKSTNKRKIVFKDEVNLDNKFGLIRKTYWHSLFKNQFHILDENEYNMIPFNILWEQGNHEYQYLPYEYDKNIFFKGYYQSFLYIDDDIRQDISNYIYSNKELVKKAENVYNKIKLIFQCLDSEMVSIHFRRTDYILEPDWICNLAEDFNYYKDALNTVNKKFLVIFSDDIEWCKNYMDKNFNEYKNIYYVQENDVAIEFLLMSMFQHNIIANSTFSLWASFISPYENKIIIAPKNWYAKNGAKSWQELYHKYITHII